LAPLQQRFVTRGDIWHPVGNFSSNSVSTVKRTRGHTIKLALPVSRIDCRKYFFSVRIVKVWNSLPDELVTAKTIHLFKSFLENQNLNKFIVGKK